MSLMIDVAGLELDAADRELLAHPDVSGFILFGRNVDTVEQVAELVRQVRSIRRDLLVAIDYEGGRVQRIREGVTRIPAMRALGAQHQAVQLARDAGLVIGAELAALDIDVPFAPVVDLDYGCSSVIGDRAFHRDPAQVATLAQALIDGLASAGLAATLKHFPGHGAVVPDSHLELPVDERAPEEIVANDLQPFVRLIRQAVPSVMTAHVVYSAVDARPASFSAVWIQDWLRKRLGFSGCVISDDLTMAGAASVGSPLDRAHLAAEAGCDLLPMCNKRENVVQALDGATLPLATGWRSRIAALRRQPKAVPPAALSAARQRLEAVQWN
ncbi:MAG: beta-N-acetylhexosaminidase [Abyssibacter sp.]|uniref:beta-N-acetylhexosaminidase n=1 Tax=Abyssibacter sp. TaxID=2320200 RepID=UPI00321B6951